MLKIKNIISLILVGWLLILLEFQIYTEFRFFDYIPFVIIFPLFLILRLAITAQVKSDYPIYFVGLVLMYIYGLYSSAYPLYLIVITILFIWYSRENLLEETGYRLFAKILFLYLVLFIGRFLIFIVKYNLDIDFITAFVVNTLAVAVVNTIIAFIVVQINREIPQEVIE